MACKVCTGKRWIVHFDEELLDFIMFHCPKCWTDEPKEKKKKVQKNHTDDVGAAAKPRQEEDPNQGRLF